MQFSGVVRPRWWKIRINYSNVLPQEKRTAKPEIPKTSVKVVLVGSKYCYMHHCISCCIWNCRLCCSSSKNDFLVNLLSHVFFETWKSGQELLPAANGNVQGCHVIGKGWYNVIQPPQSVSTIIKEKNSSLYEHNEHISPNVGTTSRPDCSHHVARQPVAAGGSFIAHMTTRGCHGINFPETRNTPEVGNVSDKNCHSRHGNSTVSEDIDTPCWDPASFSALIRCASSMPASALGAG